ncbi:MAG: MiaB/RimO family radical SAM methylthiotransferase, partial [Candidatus Cloacimonadota bacterium]|nr:MiaB/RimO family radical SAM methylthiotransferase [Candidatus Cloacimonadota bacterium]
MKVFIETYGCQMNVADSELVTTILARAGYSHTYNIEEADVIIFNTCSVRDHAEKRVLGRISNELKRKDKNPQLKIGVIGCMAQRMGNRLNSKNVDFVVGVDQYNKLPQILSKLDKKTYFVNETTVDNNQIYPDIYPTHQGNFNAFVTIMRGCNNFCSYCIVPYTRGRERSRPVNDILVEIDRAGEAGFEDVTLLGQNVNSYHYNNVNFAELLQLANQIDSIKRLRFVTSHPKDLSDEVIKAMASSSKVCEHLHLAMQSGNDEVLRRMNRGYTAAHYYDIVQKLRTSM